MISVPGSILIALAASGSCFMPFVEDIAEFDEIAADAKVDKGSTKEQKTGMHSVQFYFYEKALMKFQLLINKLPPHLNKPTSQKFPLSYS